MPTWNPHPPLDHSESGKLETRYSNDPKVTPRSSSAASIIHVRRLHDTVAQLHQLTEHAEGT